MIKWHKKNSSWSSVEQAHKNEFFLITWTLRVQAIRPFETSGTNNQTTHRYLAEDLRIPRTPRLAWGKTEHEEEEMTVNFLKYEIRLQI